MEEDQAVMENSGEYKELLVIFKKIAYLKSTSRLLSWDQETFMPERGQEHRAGQMSCISGLVHSMLTERRVGESIEALWQEARNMDISSDCHVNLREWRRQYQQAARLPEELVRDLAYSRAVAHSAWVKARSRKDFSMFEPHLQRLVDLSRKKADLLGYKQEPYDALLDIYEPGEKTSNIEAIFRGLVPGLREILHHVQSIQPQQPLCFQAAFPVEAQKILARLMAARIGFDFTKGRVDTVVHPFSTRIGPGDVRITSRWNERDFTEGLFGVLHEAGHGLYSQNLPAGHFGTPLGDSVSLGIHESQSRLWENIVGRSIEFWEYFFPLAKSLFPGQLQGVSQQDFVRFINRVRPSFIRVEADEVTYNLHIYLRFQIEREIIMGELPVKDIPGRWNELFREIFGMEVPDDSMGCLQDVHWSGAAFGYFPTYTLGNIYSAMIFDAAMKELPGLRQGFRKGNFEPLVRWLDTRIFSQGQRYRSRQLIKRITGRPPEHHSFLAYLHEKYERIFGR